VHVAADDGRNQDAGMHFIDGHRTARDDARGTLPDGAVLEFRHAYEALRNVDLVGFEAAHGAPVDSQVGGRGDVFDGVVAVAGGAPIALCQFVLLGPT